jgi:hypothetical protein
VKHSREKFKKDKEAMKTKIFYLTDSSGSKSSGEDEMMAQLKEKCHTTGKKNEKVQVITVLPNRKMQQEFEASNPAQCCLLQRLKW